MYILKQSDKGFKKYLRYFIIGIVMVILMTLVIMWLSIGFREMVRSTSEEPVNYSESIR